MTAQHVPTDISKHDVSMLVAYGIPHEHIALRIGITHDTLVKHYKYELETGLSNANEQVANVLFSKAVFDKDLGAVIFWLKTRGRWREKDPEDDKKYASLVEKLIEKL